MSCLADLICIRSESEKPQPTKGVPMLTRGINHIDLGTKDMEAPRA